MPAPVAIVQITTAPSNPITVATAVRIIGVMVPGGLLVLAAVNLAEADMNLVLGLNIDHFAILQVDNPIRGSEHLVVVRGADNGDAKLILELTEQSNDLLAR